MDYFDNQSLLRNLFNFDSKEMTIPGTKSRIVNCSFSSTVQPEMTEPVNAGRQDQENPGLLLRYFEGNSNFRYPVFMPSGKDQTDGAIILVHGLNERQWSKYLYWAQYLCENTGKGVILFPIAFHMNRSPGFWSDPRLMAEIVSDRSALETGNEHSSPFNAALSTRLDMHPEWFCASGLQSCYDIIDLSRGISAGHHPLFKAGTRTDFFAYSVGAFLLEVLLIANPDELFCNSRSFLFLGGSSFEQMRGISRYIMDSRAFEQLEVTFLRQDPDMVKSRIHIPHLHHFNLLWNSFMSVLRLDRMQAAREESFRRLSGQISAIGLSKDRVIPGESIHQTLLGSRNKSNIPVEILDFPYPYVHENPFPLGQTDFRTMIDQAFRRVFLKASEFLHG